METVCVVSDVRQFVCILIAKNASSTLRKVLGRPEFESYECLYSDIDQARLDQYFVFAFLRDPVSRLLSAYHEISIRKAGKPPHKNDKAFFAMEDNLDRLFSFLEEVINEKWDRHVQSQSDFVAGKKIDYFGRVEFLQGCMESIFSRLGIADVPIFPVQRSRFKRATVHGDRPFLIVDVDPPVKQLIRDIYREDVELLNDTFSEPVDPAFQPG